MKQMNQQAGEAMKRTISDARAATAALCWMMLASTFLWLAPAATGQVPAQPDPLPLAWRHSADTDGDAFAVDAAEAAAVLGYWRAGTYGVNNLTADGYAASGTTNGLRHSADYGDPDWSVGYEEILRLLALHRSSAYTYDANASGLFAPAVEAWPYTAPAAGSTAGTTRYVSSASTNPIAPFLTLDTAATAIQDAVAVSASGDLVLVDRGTYDTGWTTNQWGASRVVVTQGLTLASLYGPADTVISGSTTSSVRGVFLNHPQSVLLGFTVRGGATAGGSLQADVRNGGGILALGAQRIAYCAVENCSALPLGYGGGVYLSQVSGALERTVVISNSAYVGGGVSISFGGATTATHLRVCHNSATSGGGGMLADNSKALFNLAVHHNTTYGNGGGLLLANNCDVWFATVAGNSAAGRGGGVWMSGSINAIRNSILAFNSTNDVEAASSVNTISYSCLPADPALTLSLVSNVNSTPIVVDEASGNLRPLAGSPVIGAGQYFSWMAAMTDLDGAPRLTGTAPDLGAYAYHGLALSATQAYYIPGEPVEVVIRATFPSYHRPLTFGVHASAPASWGFTGLASTGNVFEASPDGGGYVLTDTLNQQVGFTVSLMAGTTATGDVPFDVSSLWMANGLRELAAASLPTGYVIRPSYPVSAAAATGGQISSTGGWYAVDSTAEFTAIADSGWRFLQWSGDTVGAEINGATIRVPVGGPLSVQAEFIQVFQVAISSPYGLVYPGVGSFGFDNGSAAQSYVAGGAVSAGETSFVCVGFTGTGSAPASSGARQADFTVTQDSSITWQWSAFSARHASRGYRAAGAMAGRITCTVDYEPSALITQVWWRPSLPAGWTLEQVGGAVNPAWENGLIVVRDQLANGSLEFHYDVTLPAGSTGLQEIGGEAGVNQPD